jgi:type IV secretory pathway VirB4 component
VRRPYRGERPGHSATTAHLQAAYPFHNQGGLGAPGAYIGRDAFGGSWVYDPWELYARGLLPGPNMLVLGKFSRGKSSLVKSYAYRQLLFGRDVWVLDPKGEYGMLAQRTGGTWIGLEPDGPVRLNAITRRGGFAAQLSLLRSVVKAALRRELDPEEDAGLRVGLEAVNAEAGLNREPVLPDVVDALLHPRASMVEGVSAGSAEGFAAANRNAALALQRLCAGDLRGMFDGETTPGLDLDAHLVVLDLSALEDSSALGVLMACAGGWLQAILTERRRTAEAEGRPGAKMILVLDEAWRVAGQIGIAEWLQSSYKLCRSLGIQTIVVAQRLTDFGAVGSAGSREARILEGLVADSDTRVLLAQAHDELPLIREKLGLSATEAELLVNLRHGEALWQVGAYSGLAQLRLSGLEREICNTDARMALERAG